MKHLESPMDPGIHGMHLIILCNRPISDFKLSPSVALVGPFLQAE